jgi:hypothetical protein
MRKPLICGVGCAAMAWLLCLRVPAQPPEAKLWDAQAQVPKGPGAGEGWVQPRVFHAFNLRHGVLRPLLQSAPAEGAGAPGALASQSLISLPMPDGSEARFRFVESPVMAPELAAQFPEIKTYLAQGVDDPAASARFDVTPAGFHAQILSPHGAVYVDPYLRGNTNLYACYYKRDYRRGFEDWRCLVEGRDATGSAGAGEGPSFSGGPLLVSGANLRTYRLAVAATAEYTAFQGGTVAAGMSAIVTAVNRVTGVYENEVAVRLTLVASNSLIVYTNAATEPYSNGNPTSLLSQNQSNLDAVIGSANYDIGHVFGTAGGGLASLGVACVAGSKARGETGTASPIGDAFYIDYVAHEMGHQFGANHPFNGTNSACGGGNRNAATAYEPGSGSTIMAYAGICGVDNLQPHSDPYFHSVSLDEIVTYTTTGSGNNCPTITSTGNTAPTVSAGAITNYTIPKSTPFILTATGSDPNGDPITYCWEERDLGAPQTLGAGDNGASPLFRSFNPTSNAFRIFPQLSDVINNTQTAGEALPTTNRTMKFRVVARDNRAGGGGVSTADMQVTVTTNAGPFLVTSPNSAVTWSNVQSVTWNVAGTTNAPVSTTNVNILLSTNGGLSFPIVLVSNTPNTGVQSVALPNITTTNARIKVAAVGNIFFDMSNTNFTIVPIPLVPAVALGGTSLLFENCFATNGVIDPGETVTISFALTNTGTADTTNLVATLLTTNGVTAPSAPQSYGVISAGGAAVSRAFTFTASGSCGGSITPVLQLQDGSASYASASNVFGLGNTTIGTQSFTNSSNITILDNAAASLYPSPITVSNLTGTVTKVTATLRGLSHTFPDDIDIILVGPGGQKTYLMSDVGGNGAINGITLTFDDAAASSLPDSGQITAGTYKPTNIDTNSDVFPGPAPAAPYVTNLTVFNGVNPNGTWSLYVRDDAVNDSGSITQGWSLSITTSNTVCCTGIVPLADIGVTQSVMSATVNVSSNLNFLAFVSNFGPSDAPSVTVTDALPASVSFVSAIASQGTWTNNAGVVTFSLGTVTNGSSVLLALTCNAIAPGNFTNTMSAITTAIDQSSSNNNSSVAFSINAFPTISSISPQTTAEDTPTPAIPFVIGDRETAAGSLSVSGLSSNTNLVANTNIVFGGSASNRTVTLTPSPNQSGTTTVSIAVSDGMAITSTNFSLTVTPVNDPPVLGALTNYTINEGATVSFTATATDVESPPEILTFTLSNAPPAATINPTNGQFNWVTSEPDGPSTNFITIIVTDDGSPPMSDSKTFSVIVNELNQPPVLPAQADRTIVGLTTLTVTNTATDPDIPTNTLSYTLSVTSSAGSVTNAVISTNGIISWTPNQSQVPGTNIFQTVVTDSNPAAINSQHLSATNSFTVVVNAIHNGPSLGVISNQVVNELATLVVTNTASDNDVPSLGLTYHLENPPTGATIDTNGVVTWVPDETQGPGTNAITTIVADNGNPSLSATNTFTVVVNEVNQPPALPSQTDRTIVGRATLTVTNTATDPDIPTNSLSYTLSVTSANGPVTNAVIDTNGVITWTPTPAQVPSTNTFETIVTDFNPTAVNAQQLSATNTFTVVVNAIHNGPSLGTISNQVVNESVELIVTNTATDNDVPALALTYQLLNPPLGAAIDTNGIITWIPDETQGPGTNVITTIVTDNGNPPLSATNMFTVVVNEINQPPALPSQPDRTIAGLVTLTVTNTATDQDIPTNTLSYTLSVTSTAGPVTNAVIDTNGVIAWTPTPSQVPSTNIFETIVTDFNPAAVNAQQLTATNAFTVVVNAIHNGPILPVQTNLTINELTLLIVTNTASDSDIPAHNLSYTVSIASSSGPVTNATINTNGIIAWTPDESQGPSTNIVTTIVTDDADPPLSATNSFTVIVNEVNSAPSLDPIADRTIVQGQTLSVTNHATDTDIPTNTLSYSLSLSSTVDPVTNIAISADGILTWAPDTNQAPSTNLISVYVTDDGSPPLSATQTFSVVVVSALRYSLPQVPDQTVIEGYTLIVSNFAAANDPANPRNYLLDTNAPAGASINFTNGLFTWTPTEAQGPSTNLLIVYVTQPGPPSQSATQSFSVFVLETNSPPALAPIADRTVHAGTLVHIPISAADSDIPTNILTFSLDAGAPAAASINPTNGLFTWPTTDADMNTTNAITVRVTDDGVPPMSDAKSFAITVVARPTILTITFYNGVATITWNSISGQVYRLQYLDDLRLTNWAALGTDVTASASLATDSDSTTPAAQRFYRVMLVP